ncbi:DUF4468 domain-containing protein [Pedobacter sp. MW01-1-1]|uniref:DUF4468 domain-containing protein n=1 Tax=Pedobacter sp. MW01-1-1 TaxID=3383027 RepID=UPI003FF01EAF
MKKYTFLLFLLLLFTKLSAQQKEFSIDESGKYIYYEVVSTKATPKDSLMQRANYFVKKLYKKTLSLNQKSDTSILAKGKTVIDKTLLIAGHPSGEIQYNFNFEARNGKYRFWLTDFNFIPYQRDRYSNYVPTSDYPTPLEQKAGKLNAGEWKDIVDGAYSKVSKFADDFKKCMATAATITVQPVTKPKTVSTDKW